MSRRRSLVVLAVLAAVAVPGCTGGGSTNGSGSRVEVVEMTMTDMAFTPRRIEVPAGEVRFVFHNRGSVTHEAVLGDEDAQQDHADAMAGDHGDMDHMGHGAGMESVTVEPGATAELTAHLHEPGELLVVCHQPGHREAGMSAVVTVRG